MGYDSRSEKTEVWVFFDRENVYFSARCWESRPDRMIVHDMRRDGNVLNEQRDTTVGRFPDLANRALIVKVTRLLRF